MSDLLIGLSAWLGVAVVVSVVIGRFMRLSDPLDPTEAVAEESGLSMLPGYGWEEEQNINPQVAAEPPHAENKRPPREKYDSCG